MSKHTHYSKWAFRKWCHDSFRVYPTKCDHIKVKKKLAGFTCLACV